MAYFVADCFLVTFQDITNNLANIQKANIQETASNRLSATIQGFLNGLKAVFSKRITSFIVLSTRNDTEAFLVVWL